MAVALGGRPIETFTGRPGMIARSAACWTLLALVACAPTRGQGDAAAAEEARPTTTVVLVRHAEKAAEPAQDPPLTEAGAARARALLDALADARANAIYSTNYARPRRAAPPPPPRRQGRRPPPCSCGMGRRRPRRRRTRRSRKQAQRVHVRSSTHLPTHA